MQFETEIKWALGLRRKDALSDAKIAADQIDPLKAAVFDFWDRNTSNVITRLKTTPGQKAFVWGGESPRDPERLATTLILAGYDKVVFVDRLSHLFGRDDMISTEMILHRPAEAVYKRRFILQTVGVYLRTLHRLRPLVEAGFVEFLPPPIFWNENACELVREMAERDSKTKSYWNVFQKGLKYRGHQGALHKEQVLELFSDYSKRVKKAAYLKSFDAEDYARKLLRGPAEELNEALLGRGLLTNPDTSVCLDLITDRERHWDWLEWKLGADCSSDHQHFERLQTLWIDGMSVDTVLTANKEAVLDDVRHFFKAELPTYCSSPDNLRELQRGWLGVRQKIEAKMLTLKREYQRRFGTRFGLVTLTLGLAAPGIFSFPEWIALSLPAASAAIGYSIKDIIGLKREYLKDRAKALAQAPNYLLLSTSTSSAGRELVPGID